jgi:hypothetical protein
MVWYKAWLETRFKLLMAISMAAGFMAFFRYLGAKPAPPGAKPILGLASAAMSFAVVLYSWLAGAGIVTQPAFQATKGIHGSTLFTLSLPVSRFRLLAVRATLGWLEMAGVMGAYCLASWLVLPVIRDAATGAEMSQYMLALISCVSSLYFLSVLLATFLDDLWRIWGGMIAVGLLWLLSSWVPLPASIDIVRAMGPGSPLLVHTMPWTTMAFSLGSAAILFFAALKVVQTREY